MNNASCMDRLDNTISAVALDTERGTSAYLDGLGAIPDLWKVGKSYISTDIFLKIQLKNASWLDSRLYIFPVLPDTVIHTGKGANWSTPLSNVPPDVATRRIEAAMPLIRDELILQGKNRCGVAIPIGARPVLITSREFIEGLIITALSGIAILAVSVIGYRDWRSQHRNRHGKCRKCGYDLGTSDNIPTCPECGRTPDSQA
jgi:hypothetical protein